MMDFIKDDVKIKLLFPTVLYQANLELQQEEIDSIKSENYQRKDQTNWWISQRTDLHLKYESLMSTINKHVDFYCKEVLQLVDTNLSCSVSWVNKLSKGDGSPRHSHTYSMVSGVLYLDVPDNSGDIAFYTPNMMFGNFFRTSTKEENDFNTGLNLFTTVKVKTGLLLLFPSVLEHSVIRNESDSDRYSFAFDYICDGNFNSISIEPTYKKLKNEFFE